MRILFIAPRLPYPPLRGYQLRAWHQLRILSERHRITLICYSNADSSSEMRRQVAQFCEQVVTVPYHPVRALGDLCGAIFSGRPIQAAAHQTPRMRLAIDTLLNQRRHDVVHVQMARMAGLVDSSITIPRVIDFVDALSLNLRRRGEHDRWPLSLASRAEANRLLRYEREICRTWNHATTVSPIDRAAIGDFPNLSINPSGVDLAEFPYHGGASRDPYAITFTGNLGYFSNVNAISWFAREIFPLIAREESSVRLSIVGARPTRTVRALSRLDRRITVVGKVDRLQPYLKRCRVAIAPMRSGSGQLFKVLEAMASGAPMVATSLVAEATEVEGGRHLLVADTAQAFARSVIRLIREPVFADNLASEARLLVEHRYRWERSVSDLEEIYHSVTGRNRRDDSSRAASV